MPQIQRELLARNCVAAFGWAFVCVFVSFVAAMTWIVVRDGAAPGWSPGATWAVVALFWLLAAGVTRYAASRPCVWLYVRAGRKLELRQRWPLRSSHQALATDDVAEIAVRETKDSDGDPYFECVLTPRDGLPIRIAEGHDRATCEAACARAHAALRA